MESPIDTKEEFSIVKRGKSFIHAWRGIGVFLKTTHKAWVCVIVLAIATVVTLGLYFDITANEWIAIVFSVGFILVSEAFNTAIEIDINLTSPTYHPYARDTKDVAAGAVLISIIAAAIIGALVFGRYLI